jgi:hypothetical protein
MKLWTKSRLVSSGECLEKKRRRGDKCFSALVSSFFASVYIPSKTDRVFCFYLVLSFIHEERRRKRDEKMRKRDKKEMKR